MTKTTLMKLSVALAILIAATALSSTAATAGKYGHRLDGDSAKGSWSSTPGAAADGRVKHPRSFTVVVHGKPVPSYFCQDKAACREIKVAWSVACKKNGRYKLKRDQIISRSRRIVAHPKIPIRHPERCSISASGQLAYYAGGSVSVAIYYRK